MTKQDKIGPNRTKQDKTDQKKSKTGQNRTEQDETGYLNSFLLLKNFNI